MEKNAKLILLRHGKSDWNQKNRFTGWVDVPLSKDGIEEAQKAGKAITHIPIDVIFISSLMRAQMTAMIAMTEHESDKTPVIMHSGEGKLEDWAKIYDPKAEEHTIPVYKSWEINERMYGELQGLRRRHDRTCSQYTVPRSNRCQPGFARTNRISHANYGIHYCNGPVLCSAAQNTKVPP